jgi:hypothetical protein
MRALHIERLPWTADWPYTFIPYEKEKLEAALKVFMTNPNLLNDACKEIEAIYAHTQAFFAKKGIQTLKLGRGYKNDERADTFHEYATTILRKQQAAHHLGVSTFEIPHDVITSWGCSWSYTQCVAGVELDIPVSDILLGAETLAPRPGALGMNAIETGEWLVLNRRLDGSFIVPVTSIRQSSDFVVKPVRLGEANDVLAQSIPAVRKHANYRDNLLREPKSAQPLRGRFARAKRILMTKYQ